MEKALLQTVGKAGVIGDTRDFAAANKYEHATLLNAVKSLMSELYLKGVD